MNLTFEFDQPSRRVNVPQTSREAHNSVKEHKSAIYSKIIKALEEIKVGGTSEEISHHLGVPNSQIHKRLPEMIESKLVFNTGITRNTTSGRKSMVRQLVRLKN